MRGKKKKKKNFPQIKHGKVLKELEACEPFRPAQLFWESQAKFQIGLLTI